MFVLLAQCCYLEKGVLRLDLGRIQISLFMLLRKIFPIKDLLKSCCGYLDADPGQSQLLFQVHRGGYFLLAKVVQ